MHDPKRIDEPSGNRSLVRTNRKVTHLKSRSVRRYLCACSTSFCARLLNLRAVTPDAVQMDVSASSVPNDNLISGLQVQPVRCTTALTCPPTCADIWVLEPNAMRIDNMPCTVLLYAGTYRHAR